MRVKSGMIRNEQVWVKCENIRLAILINVYMSVRICRVMYRPYLKYYPCSLCNFLLIARISYRRL